MQNTTVVTIAAAIAIAGCGGSFDPCSQTSPLWNGLNADQKSNCSACGDPNTSDCGSTTGYEPDGTLLLCSTWDAICYLGGSPMAALIDPGGEEFVGVAASECDGVAYDVPCGRSWAAPDEDPYLCATCDIPGYDGPRFGLEEHDNWPICFDHGATWRPAYLGTPSLAGPDWFADLGCEDQSAVRFTCPAGVIGIKAPNTYQIGLQDWTCRCPSGEDSECQPGAVCESGWEFAAGVPKPTLCWWDDGSGALPPGGPEVYGLHAWADGFDVTIAGTERAPAITVVVTPQALVGAITNAGLWNDSQRFTVGEDGLSAVIDRCESDALCSALSLAAGDVLYLDGLTTDDAYLEVAATVEHADGRVSTLVVVTE